jgi:hypothetical protein
MDISSDYQKNNGEFKHVNRNKYIDLVHEKYPNVTTAAKVLEYYPPFPGKNMAEGERNNVFNLGWSASDSFLCEQRRHLLAASRTPNRTRGQWMYRYDHWFTSNETCTTQSNWHGACLHGTKSALEDVTENRILKGESSWI